MTDSGGNTTPEEFSRARRASEGFAFRKHSVAATIFLLIGAILNMGIAWLVVVTATWNSLQWQHLTDLAWPSNTPSSWPGVKHRMEGQAHYWRVDRYISERTSDTQSYFVDIFAVGWPVRSFQWQSCTRLNHNHLEYLTSSAWNDGIHLPAWLDPGQNTWRRFPLRPVRIGFAINTAIFAFFLMAIWLGLRHIRTLLRLRADLCPRCKYPIGPSPVCTECGHTFSGQKHPI